MATTVISLRHNSIKENLMTLHNFWFICRNSLSRIITFASCEFFGLQSWNVFSMGPHNFSCYGEHSWFVLWIFGKKNTQKRCEKLISLKMGMNFTRNFQVFVQHWLLHICFCLKNWPSFKHSHLGSWIHYWTNYQQPRDIAFTKFNKPLRTAERIHLSLKISLSKWKLNRNSDQILACGCIVKASCSVFCNRN